MTEANSPEYEYVDLVLDIKDGKIVGCEYFGEGVQFEPLMEPVLYLPAGQFPWPRSLKRLERLIKTAIRTRF